MASLIAVCVSERKEEPKKPVETAYLDPEGGVRGDAHYGSGHRQISMLRSEDVDAAASKAGFDFPNGSLAENLRIRGIPAEALLPGIRLRIGDTARLEVTERGKRPEEPHSYSYRGWCLLPQAGYFLCVLSGGDVAPGDAVYLEGRA